ncbi:MAG: acyltransferase family protein [Lachnospiraceae bacterium]|nr:acyltransferase family protein [Lachnospiraceae bacterium]
MNESRRMSFDILRIIAAFSVVLLHACGNIICRYPFGNPLFNGANFIDSVSRYGVPIFVMISGALFLDKSKKTDIKRLWLHSILRLFVIYVLWSVIYYLFMENANPAEAIKGKTIAVIINGVLHADEYLWFFLMLIALYALSPVFKKWTETASRKDVEYFLTVFIVFGIVINTVVILADSYTLSQIAGKLYLVEDIGYLGYFVLGYYLTNYELSAKVRRFIYISLPFDIVINYLSSYFLSVKRGEYNPGVYDSFGLFTFLETVEIFIAVMSAFDNGKIKGRAASIIKNIAMDTLGVYLLHEIILDRVGIAGLSEANPITVLWVIPYAIALFAVCAVISEILRRIPVVGKYIC